jgi:TonB family protein
MTRVALLFALVAAAHADPRVRITITEEQPALPPAYDPKLPSAEKIAGRIKAVVGNSVTAAIRVCVAPIGSVASVSLVRASAFAPYDQAVMTDARAWKFVARFGDTACAIVNVSYDPM